jgi:hypothetical protein
MRAAIDGRTMGGLVTVEMGVSRPKRYWAIGLVATTAEPVTPRSARRGLIGPTRWSETGCPSWSTTCTPALRPVLPAAVRERVDAMMSKAPSAGAAAALRGDVHI